MKVELGLLLSGGAKDSGTRLAGTSLRLARVARDAGFTAIVAGQHFLTAPATYLQPVPMLARLVPETADMRLVTGVLLLPLLHPVQLAEELASLDVISGGRLVVGVGQGYRDTEFHAFGIDRAERLSRQLEAIELLQQIWSGGRIDFHGRHHTVTADGAAMTPVQRPHPPIWYAASSVRTVQRAAGAGYVPYLGPQVDSPSLERLSEVGIAENVRGIALRRDILVTDVVDEQTVRQCVQERESRYASWGYDMSDDGDAEDRLGPTGPYVIGTVEECRDRLSEYARLGVTTIILRVTWTGLSVEASVEMLEALAPVSAALSEA